GEEIGALDLVALGQAQHLPSQRGQSAVERIEVVDQELDLGGVELHALDFGGELLAQVLVLLFLCLGEFLAAAENLDALGLDLLELLEQVGDAREALEGFGLQRGFHLGQRKRVVLVVVLFLAAARARAALFAVIVVGLFFFFLGFLVLLVGRARGGFVDLARVGFLVLLLHLLDRRFFR